MSSTVWNTPLFPGAPASATTPAWMPNSSTSPWLSCPPLWQISSWAGTFQGQQIVSEPGKPKKWSLECRGGAWEKGLWGRKRWHQTFWGHFACLTLIAGEFMGNSNRRWTSHSLGQHRNTKTHSMVSRTSVTWSVYSFFWTWKNQGENN